MVDFNNYQPMLCPVCGKFYFSELTDEDIVEEKQPQCRFCGWINDASQVEDFEAVGLNELSLKDYKANYEKIIADNPTYEFKPFIDEEKPHVCPVCKKYSFGDENSFDICPVCGWEDDALMESNPNDWAGTSNDLCLYDYIERYNELVSKNPNYKWKNK